MQGWINFRARHDEKVTALEELQKLNCQRGMLILQQGRIIRITSRTSSNNSGLSGFSDVANIGSCHRFFSQVSKLKSD